MQQKRVLYLSFVDYADPRDWGVSRKVDGQIRAFETLGYHVDQLKIEDKCVYINNEYLLKVNGKIDYYLRLPLKLLSYFKKKRLGYELIYLRKTFFTPLYYCWFRRLKQLSPYILFEIPTYPYKVEIQGRKLPLLLDDMAFTLLKPMLYKIITTQDFDQIEGLKTIKIRNGYDFSGELPQRKSKQHDQITLITVSNLSFWHGVERLLYGMKIYNDTDLPGKKKIVFHVVGVGDAYSDLLELKEELRLDNVYFHGAVKGEALQHIYSEADIGIGSFGLYKKGTTFQSSLKNMEYCYQGIPLVLGNHDEDLKDCDFMLECPNDSTPVDVKRIVDWFLQLKVSAAEIQRKGKSLYSWEKQIKIILNDVMGIVKEV
jgi:hypothetical protein